MTGNHKKSQWETGTITPGEAACSHQVDEHVEKWGHYNFHLLHICCSAKEIKQAEKKKKQLQTFPSYFCG